jgi:opacity protein-like surface antigen
MAASPVVFTSDLSGEIDIPSGTTYAFTLTSASASTAFPTATVKCEFKIGTVFVPYNIIGINGRREQVSLTSHQNVRFLSGPLKIRWNAVGFTGGYYVEQNT